MTEITNIAFIVTAVSLVAIAISLCWRWIAIRHFRAKEIDHYHAMLQIEACWFDYRAERLGKGEAMREQIEIWSEKLDPHDQMLISHAMREHLEGRAITREFVAHALERTAHLMKKC